MDFLHLFFLADFMALRPGSYFVRITMAIAAFAVAMNVEKVIARVFGLVVLVLTGGGLLLIGILKGTVIDILLGILALGAAGYSWWFTHG